MRLRFCFLSREFILSDCFNFIVHVSGRYVAKYRDLCVLSREFGVLDKFESIDGNFSGGILKKGRDLFCSFSKSL